MVPLSIFKHSLMISFFVFVMMLLVDFVDTISKKRILILLKEAGGDNTHLPLFSVLPQAAWELL